MRGPRLLGARSAFGCRFLAIALVESINASCRVDELLLTGEERVASRADFDVQVVFSGRAGFEALTASATNGYFVIFRVDSWFHYFLSLHGGAPSPVYKQVMIGVGIQNRQVYVRTTDFTDKWR